MKTLTRIRLVNWHLFENTTIDCQGSTYFIGINGAGKSTILDAVQFALVGGQREVRFNQAALAGSKRSLASYVRGELGTEGQRFLRGDATGVIALEFRNPDGSFFTHGVVIDAFEDGRNPAIVYFIVHNARLDDRWFFKEEAAPGRLYDTRGFKRHLEHFALLPGGRAQVFTRLEDYRVHLLNRLGQLKDSFPAKIVKGLAFSPLTDIRAFVHNYLLDENLLDIKTLQAQLDTLRHFESLAADVRQRIATLNQIAELDKERAANRRRRITNGYIARRSRGEIHSGELRNARLKLDETRLSLSRAELQRDQLAANLKFAETALLDARIALQTDQAAVKEHNLREQLAALEAELKILRQRKTETDRQLAKERADAQRLCELLAVDQQDISPVITAFQAEDSNQPMRDLQAIYTSLGQEYTRQQALLAEQAANLRSEAAQMEDEIRKLRTGDREVSFESEAPQASRLRRLLRAELGLASEEVVFLCTLLNIPDKEWQDAVEGILGQNRFAILVPPSAYDAAMRLYQQRRHKDGLHGVALLDTEAILRHTSRSAAVREASSLAEEVNTVHPAGRAFVDLLLGHYIKRDAIEGLRSHRTAVTRDCFVRRNYTDTHLNPNVYGRWFIGERAAPRQIESRQKRLDEIANEMALLQQRDSALRQRLALTSEKIRALIDLEHALDGLAILGEREAQYAGVSAELSGLDLHSAEALHAEAERRQAEYAHLQTEVAALERKMGGLEAETRSLAEQDIPRLEREIDQAIQDAEDFLATMDQLDEELRAEIGKEYARRLERQPVDVIQQNAGRYESDYQSAESRNRDRLREAKQAYSLRYDFGYDDEEHAARYAAECSKLVESELPQYEAQIAHQRALAEQELVENFIHRLREQIEEARQQLAYLNSTLAQLRFGGERYEFITQPAPGLRAMYDMVMDSQNILGASLFDSDFRQKHQQAWDLLLERLTANNQSSETLAAELRELQDYRSYLQYDIRIYYPNSDRALLSQINAKKSGGETTTPFYVAMAASFAQAYRLNQPRPSDTIRLALFDEAFGKMDTARTASALQFMREAGLQVLLATPPDKSGALLPFVDTVCTVVRKNSHAFVIEIDKSDMLKEIEQAAK
ncbi:MAG: AAA family ATPase [Anaerolineales bacterium]|nr:AAA family ATPase [Anaerolineales bacterium]